MESLLSITETTELPETGNFRAYLLESTAQTSIDKEEETVNEDNKPSKKIGEIVQYIFDAKAKNPNVIVNVVIQIHGYNTGEKYNRDYKIARNKIDRMQGGDRSSDNIVIFLGYAWPSEEIAFFNSEFICDALKSLPGWLQFFSLMGIPWIGTGMLWLGMNTIFPGNLNDFFNIQLDRMQGIWLQILNSSDNLLIFSARFILNLLFYTTALSSIVTTITLVLILLRSTVYFRDSYRATHYGVPDLVQFFRAFEYLLLDRQDPKEAIKDKLFKGNRIKLSFIAHSMGAFVTTNLVRALSDVFDSNDRDFTRYPSECNSFG
jgi:hypothetical protein